MDTENENFPALALENVSKDYCSLWNKILLATKIKKLVACATAKSRRAVNGLNITINRGQIYGFVGQNGAGKSTTLKMACGIFAPDEGTVTICGHDLKKDRVKALSYVGAIVETPTMYENLSGLDNLKYLASLSGVTDREILTESLETVGLSERAKDKVATYSLGMKQRLGLAQAIVHKPALLILDEPTNGLDPQGIAEMRGFLKKLAKEHNVAVFVSSHILPEMQLLCDRIGIIDKGILVKELELTGDETTLADTYLILSVDNSDLTSAILSERFKEMTFTVDGGKFSIKTEEKDAPNITRELVLGGVNVHSVNIKKQSLEEIYLGYTSGATAQSATPVFAEFDTTNSSDGSNTDALNGGDKNE